jgi:hypothetical protein
MAVSKLFSFDGDGRLYGAYVYLLLCRDEGNIYIKIGHTRQLEKRFLSLKNNCAVTPRSLSYIRTPDRMAKVLERELHSAFDKWRVAGEWFSLRAEDKKEFNEKLRFTMSCMKIPSWPLELKKLAVGELIRQSEARQQFHRARFARARGAHKAFLRDSR